MFGFSDANWSLVSASWLDNHNVQLILRKYPGDQIPGAVDVQIDCSAKTAKVGTTAVPSLNRLEQILNDAISHNRANA